MRCDATPSPASKNFRARTAKPKRPKQAKQHNEINPFHSSLPSASGIELIELGGITPTSVTTAVMLVGGVRSYSGFRISRLGAFCSVSVEGDLVSGKEAKKSPTGAG